MLTHTPCRPATCADTCAHHHLHGPAMPAVLLRITCADLGCHRLRITAAAYNAIGLTGALIRWRAGPHGGQQLLAPRAAQARARRQRHPRHGAACRGLAKREGQRRARRQQGRAARGAHGSGVIVANPDIQGLLAGRAATRPYMVKPCRAEGVRCHHWRAESAAQVQL